MKKKFISILLCLCMVLMLCPVTALAENSDATELQNMLDNAKPDELVKLNKDYTIDTTLEVKKTVTLDLNGYVTKITGNDRYSVIKVSNEGELTLTDSRPMAGHTGDASLPAGGVITRDDSSMFGGGVHVESGSFTMEGGTIYNCSATSGGGVYVAEGGSFTMTGGTIYNCKANSPGGGGVFVGGGSFTMSGGAISGCSSNDGGGGVFVGGGSFTMSGGTISDCSAKKGGDAIAAINNSTINANGGTIYSEVESFGQILNTSTSGCTEFYGEVKNLSTTNGSGTISGGIYYGGIQNQNGGTVTGTYHTVSFNLNGGSGSVPTQWFVNIDTAPALQPADPTKDDYIFTGWYTDEALTNLYDFSSAVTENITLYAGFEQITYIVTYDGGGESGLMVGVKAHGVDLTLPGETFYRNGYVQIGWMDASGKFYDLGGVYSANADVTLYPVYDQIITLTVPFTTTVKLGGSEAPGKTTFELALIDSSGNDLKYDDVYFGAVVTTDGAGDYDGELTITAPLSWLEDMLGKGAFVWQYDDGEAGWTYDDTVWCVCLYEEIAARSVGSVPYSLLVYPTYIKDDGSFAPVPNAEPLERMSFTNIYKYSAPNHNTTTIVISGDNKPAEQNPNTGASVAANMSTLSVLTIAAAAAAALKMKKH